MNLLIIGNRHLRTISSPRNRAQAHVYDLYGCKGIYESRYLQTGGALGLQERGNMTTTLFKPAWFAAAISSGLLFASPVAAQQLTPAPAGEAVERPAVLALWLQPFAHSQSAGYYSLEVASLRLVATDMNEPVTSNPAASNVEAAAFAMSAPCVHAGLLKPPSFANEAISCHEVEPEPFQPVYAGAKDKIALNLASADSSGAAE